jgi:CheY-like chemotaxis protein
LQAKACTVRQLEDKELSVGYAWGYKSTICRDHRIAVDERLGSLLVDRRPLLIRDLLEEPGIPESRRKRAELEGFRGCICLPMAAFGLVEGVLTLYYPVPHEFTEAEVAADRIIADCLALCIQRCRFSAHCGCSGPSEKRKSSRKRTVLVVDDIPAIRMLYQSALQREGYDCVADLPAAAAVAYAQRNEIALLITDNRMPGISGLTVAQEVKKRYPKAKVLMVTASPQDISREDMANGGIDFCLAKPCTLAALFQTVSTLLE